MSIRDRITLTLWLACLTSLGELSLLGVDKVLFSDRFIFRGHDSVWLTPLANLLIFSTISVLILALARRWPRLATLSHTGAALLFLSLCSVLLGVRGLYGVAAVVLAMGLTVAAMRVVARSEPAWLGFVRRSLPLVVLTAVVVGLSFPVVRAVGEAMEVRRLPAAAPSPNVLLIVLDTIRADRLSVYGYERQTSPQLERLAERGVVFDRAVTTASWTLPAHGSMFTGRRPLELAVDWKVPLDRKWPTLAEVLGARGYLTAGFVGNTGYAGWEYGLNRGFQHFEDYNRSPGQLILSSTIGQTISNTALLRQAVGYWHMLGRKLASDVNHEFLTWLSGAGDRPFFAFLNYFDAHEPLNPPPPFDRAFGQTFKSPKLKFNRATHWGVWPNMKKLSPSDRQVLLDAYDAVIAYEDEQLGRLLDALATSGKLSNTIVIVTSDHGEAFGEHGEFSHGGGLYWPVLHVPLIVSFPDRVPSNRRVTTPVSLIDLPATIADLTGAASISPMPGVSLASLWNGDGPASKSPSPVVSEHRRQPAPSLSVVANDLHYIRDHKGGEELYNIAKDPAETNNLLQGSAAGDYKGLLPAFRCSVQKDCASGPQ